MNKYFNDEAGTTKSVYFKLLGKDGSEVGFQKTYACFSDITYGKIPDACEVIRVHHERNMIPYKNSAIRRWVRDINEMGFPCKIETLAKEGAAFLILPSYYKWKPHLCATLMLIRALYESGICKVPEIYFQAMDGKPDGDKFDTMQSAHKKVGGYCNTNHMVTYKANGANVTFDKLMAGFAATGKNPFYQGDTGQDRYWAGE